MHARWAKLVEIRKRALDDAERALGHANASEASARAELGVARAMESAGVHARDAAVLAGLREREWGEHEAWLAQKRAEATSAERLVAQAEDAVARASELVRLRALELFRIEALEGREEDAARVAETRRERVIEDEQAAHKHGTATSIR